MFTKYKTCKEVRPIKNNIMSSDKGLHTLDSEARRSKVTLVKRDEGGRKGSLELDAVNFALILGAADSPYRVFQG